MGGEVDEILGELRRFEPQFETTQLQFMGDISSSAQSEPLVHPSKQQASFIRTVEVRATRLLLDQLRSCTTGALDHLQFALCASVKLPGLWKRVDTLLRDFVQCTID